MARVADVNRGWAKFCSKSCKAIRQEQRTGQYASYLASALGGFSCHEFAMDSVEDGWDGHKNSL